MWKRNHSPLAIVFLGKFLRWSLEKSRGKVVNETKKNRLRVSLSQHACQLCLLHSTFYSFMFHCAHLLPNVHAFTGHDKIAKSLPTRPRCVTKDNLPSRLPKKKLKFCDGGARKLLPSCGEIWPKLATSAEQKSYRVAWLSSRQQQKGRKPHPTTVLLQNQPESQSRWNRSARPKLTQNYAVICRELLCFCHSLYRLHAKQSADICNYRTYKHVLKPHILTAAESFQVHAGILWPAPYKNYFST